MPEEELTDRCLGFGRNLIYSYEIILVFIFLVED